MQTNLFIKSSFESVFLVNGIFLERPKSLIISKQGVTYITVLPLSSALLPYTVKLCGESVASNQELCESVTLSENKMLLLLKPRYNYVYTSQPEASSFSNTKNASFLPGRYAFFCLR